MNAISRRTKLIKLRALVSGMIQGFEPRLYQETIFSTVSGKNTLVVLPTGMGKTAIAMMLAAHRLKLFPKSKILFLAPTKPLVEQHLRSFQEHLDVPMAVFTGEVAPAKRAAQWTDAKIIFSTPQGMGNDVINQKVQLKDVSLLVLDEAHKAVGNYDYVFLAKQYMKKAGFPRILGLTASPGSDQEKIQDVCKNLFIEAVEIRSIDDPDVKEYVQEMDFEWIKVELPEELKKVQKFLKDCLQERTSELKKYGVRKPFLSKTDLLSLQRQLQAKLSSGQRDFSVMKSLSLVAELMKAQHALELLETQGLAPLHAYLTKMFEEAKTSKVKAVKNLTSNVNFRSALVKTAALIEKNIEHPKLTKLHELVEKEISANNKAKIILFTQFRDSAVQIKEKLENIKDVVPVIFVGQAKKSGTGLSQKEQAAILEQFRDGLYNVLIATSVAEEGLDIPKVDVVMFYEPVPSAIRTIQRRGRTGRQDKGRVTVLMTQGTRDEGYRWSAHHKEKRMNRVLNKLKQNFDIKQPQQKLNKFEQGFLIFADYREKGSGIIKELADLGVQMRLEMLDSADYMLSPRVGVEVKTVPDFVGSIIDGRLLEQLRALSRKFERPVVIIEGTEDMYSVRKVHPNAIRGMLATIAVSYGIPVLRTADSKETAALLVSISKREQEYGSTDFTPHSEKRVFSVKEQQEYLVSSLPSVGPSLAKELLKQFKSIKALVNASEEELKQVSGVGDKIAKAIRELVEKEYA